MKTLEGVSIMPTVVQLAGVDTETRVPYFLFYNAVDISGWKFSGITGSYLEFTGIEKEN